MKGSDLYGFIEEDHQQAFLPFQHNAFSFFLLGTHPLGWPKISRGGETSVNHFVQGWNCMEDAQKFPT